MKILLGFSIGVVSVLFVLLVEERLIPPATFLDCMEKRAEILTSKNAWILSAYCRQYPDTRKRG